jgi:hypothetical protein
MAQHFFPLGCRGSLSPAKMMRMSEVKASWMPWSTSILLTDVLDRHDHLGVMPTKLNVTIPCPLLFVGNDFAKTDIVKAC